MSTESTDASTDASTRASDRTARRQPGDLTVPLVDMQDAARVYDPSILRCTVIGAVAGALLLGLLLASIVAGSMPIAGLGQIAAGGTGAAVVAGGSIGAALGGCIGGIAAMVRLPARTRPPGSA